MKTWELLSDYRELKEGDGVNKSSCIKCNLLFELYEKIPIKSNRDYWLMTELFVLLHGSDECKGKKE